MITCEHALLLSLRTQSSCTEIHRTWALIWDPFAWCQRIQLPIKQYQLALWFRYRCAHRNGHQFLEPLEWHLGCVTLLFGGSILWYNIFGNITDSFLYPLAFQAKTLNDSTTRPSSGDHECSLKCRLRMSELSTLWCLICWQFSRSAPTMTLRWLGRCTATAFTDLISYSQQWSTDCWYPSQLQTLHRAHKQQHRSKKLTVSSHDAPLGWVGWEWGWGCKSWIRSHSNSCSEMQCTIVISSKWEEPECLLHLCASCGMWNVLAIN